MRYAEVDTKGNFTGQIYEDINERIIADRAGYGHTIVAIERGLTNANAADSSKAADYGKPTEQELARPVKTLEAKVKELEQRIAALEKSK